MPKERFDDFASFQPDSTAEKLAASAFAFCLFVLEEYDGGMIEFRYTGEELYARMELAVERVNQRLSRAIEILEGAEIPYAIVGGFAVRAWVAQVDVAAVRTTRDVDVLIRPSDLPALITAMTDAGLHHRETSGSNMFVETPDASARDVIHIVLAGEMVRADDFEANPDIEPSERNDQFRTIPLESLVRMKLNSFRDKDRVHVRDMISLELIDKSWLDRFPPTLADRLKELLDDPHG